jgi:UDP-GlcNAc:undecaprenyl-phosphate/decaprenyl-phosphate GlcNAc-1-phosphate transferase
MLGPIVLLVLVGLAIALPGTAVMRWLGRRLGAMDAPGVAGQVKAGNRPIPNTGGVAIFAALAGPIALGLVAVWTIDAATIATLSAPLAQHIEGIRTQTPMVLTFLACLAALHLMGVVDDRRPLAAIPKLLLILGVSTAIVLASPTRLAEFLTPFPGGVALSVLVTIVWIVVITNALNFLDNMDGLCAGVGVIASACFLASALITGQWFIAAVLALLVGALLGFLVFNAPPASIFMGDGGSLVVGFTLAFLTVQTTYTGTENDVVLAGGWYAALMPLIVLAVPLYDFSSVVLIRLVQGKSPFVGDLQHFSHRLVDRGLSKRAAVFVILGITLATGIGGISLASLAPWQAALVGLQTLVLLGVLAVFELRAAPRSEKGSS